LTPAGALDSYMSPGVLTVSAPADTVARVCPAQKFILLKLSSSILLCLVSGLAFSSASRSLFSVAALFPGSAALVHDADAVVGRKTRNCRHKQPHRKRH
jgi:hypothetical protein